MDCAWRLPETPVTELATYELQGHQFRLLSYRDSAGRKVVALSSNGQTASVSDVPVDERNLVSQGSWLSSRSGVAAVYGRAHDTVTAIYSVTGDGDRTDWPIHDDPRNGERYFAVIVDTRTVADIVAESPAGRTSLRRYFSMWFHPPGRQGRSRRVPEPEGGS